MMVMLVVFNDDHLNDNNDDNNDDDNDDNDHLNPPVVAVLTSDVSPSSSLFLASHCFTAPGDYD